MEHKWQDVPTTIFVTQNPNTLSVIKSCCKLQKNFMYKKLNAHKDSIINLQAACNYLHKKSSLIFAI